MRYYVESFVPAGRWEKPAPFWLGKYLLDLMEAHEYAVVPGTMEWEWPEPQLVRYPEGWTLARVSVMVREFDAEV